MYDIARPARDALAGATRADLAAHDEKMWALAFDLLIAENDIAAAQRAIGPLHAHFPSSTFLTNMAMVLGRLPPPSKGPHAETFADDPAAEVQIVPCEGAKLVLLGFAGNGGKMSLPLNLMHRWFAPRGIHVIYLRDLATKLYVRGIKSLGDDYPETIAALRSEIAALGATRIMCQGHSGGGYAALRIGLELGAEAILTFGAQTNPTLDPDEKARRLLRQFGVEEALDLCPLYDRATRPPRARLVFSEGHERDARQAQNMAGVPGFTLEPVSNGEQHGVFMPVLKSGRYDHLLRELLTGEAAPPPTRA